MCARMSARISPVRKRRLLGSKAFELLFVVSSSISARDAEQAGMGNGSQTGDMGVPSPRRRADPCGMLEFVGGGSMRATVEREGMVALLPAYIRVPGSDEEFDYGPAAASRRGNTAIGHAEDVGGPRGIGGERGLRCDCDLPRRGPRIAGPIESLGQCFSTCGRAFGAPGGRLCRLHPPERARPQHGTTSERTSGLRGCPASGTQLVSWEG